MPAKRPKAQNGVTGERKISSFFKPDGMPLEIAGKKRSNYIMHLSLLWPTLPGWWWIGRIEFDSGSMHFERSICLIWGIFTAHLCSPELMKEIALLL